MGNILDYLDWRGDLTFEQTPFNQVDNLILACFSYLDLDEIADVKNGNTLSVEELFEIFSGKEKDGEVKAESAFLQNTPILLEKMASSERFRKCRAGGYVNEILFRKAQQFSAVTVELPDGTAYISFRGTDDTIVGWKEDFNLCFQENIPSQISALNYVNNYKSKHILILGGHSIGANLALYAGIYTQNSIFCIYNHDGPGFLTPYQTNKKVFKTIPQSSINGLLLEETNNYQIIQSEAISILQHDPFTWCVENGDFIYLEQNDQLSKHTQSTLSKWLKSIDVNTRKQVIDTIYSIFSDYENPKDFRQNIDVIEMIKSIQNMDSQTKKMISETIQVLFKCIQNEIKRGN